MNKVIAGNVTMYQEDWELIDRLAEALGLNRSAAMRIIVRDWKSRSGAPEAADTESQEECQHG